MVKSLAVLGLDAMPWHYLNKLLNSGVMPYTKTLINRSFKTKLECIPPVTPPSWTSIMTGVNPGKHGIFGFFTYDRTTWKQVLTSANHVKHPRIHEMLSMNGVESIVFNPIPDYPLIPVSKALQVSNLFFTPKPVSQPKEIYAEFFGDEDPKNYTNEHSCEIMKDYVNALEIYEGAIEKAINTHHSFLWITLNAPDVLLHRCPKVLQKESVDRDEAKVFSKIDKFVKLLRESHSSLIIVSDHGFKQYDYLVSINDLLIKNGLAASTPERKIYEFGDYAAEKGLERVNPPKKIVVHPLLYAFVKKLHLSRAARSALYASSKILGRRVEVRAHKYVDPENSKAFLPDYYTFGIYLKDPSIKEKVKSLLREHRKLLAVHEVNEVYDGPYINLAPDIVVFPNFSEGYWLAGSELLGKVVQQRKFSTHYPEGILVVSSDTDLPDEVPEKLPNYSVATIALSLMEQPLPKSRDKVEFVEEHFTKGLPEKDYISRWVLAERVRKLKLGKQIT